MAPGTFVNNLSSEYMVLGINMGLGVELTEKLSVGATLTLGTGFEQLGLTGPLVSSAMVNAYALRGTFGLDYAFNPCNTVGVFYQTRMDFQFPNAIRIGNDYNDHVDLSAGDRWARIREYRLVRRQSAAGCRCLL